MKEMFIMSDDSQEPSEEVATRKHLKKVADDTIILEASERESELRQEKENLLNQNLELFELMVQEKSFSFSVFGESSNFDVKPRSDLLTNTKTFNNFESPLSWNDTNWI